MELSELIPETRPQPGFIVCNIDAYYDLNRLLSQAKGLDLTKNTQRCKGMNPKAAKADIQYDNEGNETGYTAKVVFPLSSQEQIDFPELFEGFEIVNSYVPTGEEIYEFIISVMGADTINWTVEQLSAVKGLGKEVTIYVSQELYDNLPQQILTTLSEMGLSVLLNV